MMLIRTPVQDDMFTPDVIADPYSYYGRLRDEDPVHWNKAMSYGPSHATTTWSG